MATTKTIKASGGDYTSLYAWEDAIEANLTGTGVAEAVCYSLDDTTAVSIVGWTTTASDYIYIHTDSSAYHGGIWNGDKYNLSIGNADALTISEDYVRIDGIQVEVPTMDGAGDNPVTIGSISASNDIRLSNMIIRGAHDASNAQRGITVDDADTILYMWNTIVYNINVGYGVYLNCSTASIYSCTVLGGSYAIYRNAGTVTLKNCYAGDSATLDYDGDFSAVVNCASEDLSADDDSATDCLTSVALGTDTFVSVAGGSENFHLAADGLSPLQGFGVSTTGESAPLNFTTDIDGQTRDATWDIGADAWFVSTSAYNVVMNII